MKIIVWKKNDNTYYYKLVKGTYKDYFVGYENQYRHVVILIIDLPVIYKNFPFKYRIKKRLIRFLEKF